MKRLIISILVLFGIGALCLADYIPRSSSRKRMRKIIQLAEPKLKGQVSLEEALVKRRSVRVYADRALGFKQIGQLAWAGQGITEPKNGLRTAPSAGSIYPIELHFVTREGAFVYRPADHSLEQTVIGDLRVPLAMAASKQESVARAPCDIVIVGSTKKLAGRFRDKARTYMLLEAGHIAQNIQLQAVCLGLGSVTVGGINTREVAKICKLGRNFEALYIISVGYPMTGADATGSNRQNAAAQVPLALGTKAVFIVPSQGFRDDELFETKRVLDQAGVETHIASTTRGIIKGMLGNAVEAKILMSALRVDDYDAIIFIGGAGVKEYFEDPVAKSIAHSASRKRMILAAISAAPTILANAGALTGRRATSFESEHEKLQQGGAIFTGEPVEWDAHIITCSGPAAAQLFGRAIAEALAAKK